jgi:hypothetical protein
MGWDGMGREGEAAPSPGYYPVVPVRVSGVSASLANSRVPPFFSASIHDYSALPHLPLHGGDGWGTRERRKKTWS